MGNALARLEGRIALDEILKRFPAREVDWPNAAPSETAAVRGWAAMPTFVSCPRTSKPTRASGVTCAPSRLRAP